MRLAIRPALVVACASLLVPFATARAGDDAKPADHPDWAVKFESGTPAWADVLAKAKEQKKPIFADFTTEWCGWCRRLEKDVYTKAEVGEAMQAFVNVMIDA